MASKFRPEAADYERGAGPQKRLTMMPEMLTSSDDEDSVRLYKKTQAFFIQAGV
jgi:hypothetical protein